MLMSLTSGFCAKLAGRNQIASGDPIALNTSLHLKRRLTVDPNRKTASCFLAPFRAVGNAFRWTLEKIYIARFPAGDRKDVVGFLKEKDEIVLKVVEEHLTTFQNAWPSKKIGSSPQAIRDFISGRYMPCFREKFVFARARDPKADIKILFRIAHRLATAKVLDTPELHEGPLQEINHRVQEKFNLNGDVKKATVRFVKLHYE